MKNLFIVLFLFVFISCTHRVNVPLTVDYQNNTPAINSFSTLDNNYTFVKGEYIDKRVDVSKLASFKQEIHTFDLYAERPIGDVIFEGLSTLIHKAGKRWSLDGSGNIKINLQLLSLTASRNAGMIHVGANSTIQIKLDFIDMKTQRIIYTQIYNGSDDRKQAMIGLMNMVKDSINSSIINCINSVANDKMLIESLKQL